MTYFLMAIAVLVCWYVAGLAIFTLIDREVGDGDTPETQRERNFAKIGAGLVMIFAMWAMMDPLTALGWRIDNIRPLVAECRAGSGAACQKLAITYRDGLGGNCAWDGDSRLRSRDCEFVAKNEGKALEFANLACSVGNADGCLAAITPSAPAADPNARLQQVRDLCGRGAMAACDEYLLSHPETPMTELLQTETEKQCDQGNRAVCLYQMRDRLLEALSPQPDRTISWRMGQLTLASHPRAWHGDNDLDQARALEQLSGIIQHPTVPQAMLHPDGAAALALRDRIMAVPMPSLAEGAPR